jgi:hypothetical protein
MKFKRIYIYMFTLILTNCSGVKDIIVSSSTKRIHYPGIQTGKTFVQYKIEFTSENNFNIESVKLNTIKDSLEYDLYNTQFKKYLKRTEEHLKGTYILTFKTSDIKLINDEDYVSFSFKTGNRIRNKKIKIDKKGPFRAR